MRREEMVLGADYYWASAARWKEGLPGNPVVRIRVTDLGMWQPVERPKWLPDLPPYRRVTGHGQGGWILGVEVEEDGTLGREQAVWIKHIRGPWEETRELVAENVRRREEMENRSRLATAEKLAAADAAAQLLRAKGWTVHTDLTLPGYVKVRAEDVRQLLEQDRAA